MSPVIKPLAFDFAGTSRMLLKPQQRSGKLLGSYGQNSPEPPKLRRPREFIALAETQMRSEAERGLLNGDLGHWGQATVLSFGVMVNSHAVSRGFLHHKLKAGSRRFSRPVLLHKQGAFILCLRFFLVHTRKPGPPIP